MGGNSQTDPTVAPSSTTTLGTAPLLGSLTGQQSATGAGPLASGINTEQPMTLFGSSSPIFGGQQSPQGGNSSNTLQAILAQLLGEQGA